jgi:hypothetical protein
MPILGKLMCSLNYTLEFSVNLKVILHHKEGSYVNISSIEITLKSLNLFFLVLRFI